MKKLAICVPNYNRPEKLERLLFALAEQIRQNSLEDMVEICISDDCSLEDPTNFVCSIQEKYSSVTIRYKRNDVNRGMDYNFLSSVLLSDSLYCWIIGNDDLPTDDGIKTVVDSLEEKKESVDIMVTPFDVLGRDGRVRNTIYPLSTESETEFDTGKREDYERLLGKISHNSGLFGFLSNVVFKRRHWEVFRERFQDKMGTIFIQMYMNIQLLEQGGRYRYLPRKIVRNYADDAMNVSIRRCCDVLLGLDGVINYFYSGRIRERLKRVIVDEHITGMVWGLPEWNEYKKRIREISTRKNEIYRRFFLMPEERKQFFERNKKVILFGAGNFGRKAMEELGRYGAEILAVADSDPQKHGNMFGSHVIIAPGDIRQIYKAEQAYIVIANNRNLEEMTEQMMEQGMERIAVIT